jgi:Rod binding domain-containing protein
MNIQPLKPHIDATEIAPERLAGNPALTDKQKIAEASRQFEVILLKQILEASQKTVIKSKYAGDSSTSSDIYHGMVTTQLAESISKSGAFGLAKTFEQQLDRPEAAKPDGDAGKSSPSSHKKTISAGAYSPAQHLKPLHERTFNKSH